MNDTRIATRAAALSGHFVTFLVALGLVLVWAASGPFFGFGEEWQIVINTPTTIVTFLMVFLIQHSQNRDTLALHLKLDELIRATAEADDALMRAEDETEEELDALKARYAELVEENRRLAAGADRSERAAAD